MAQSRKHNAWNEVMGLVLLGAGTVLFLALISYTPKDVPSWVWFSSVSPPNNPAQNFIGPTGAIIAGFLYLTLGSCVLSYRDDLFGVRRREAVSGWISDLKTSAVGCRVCRQRSLRTAFAALVSTHLETRF